MDTALAAIPMIPFLVSAGVPLLKNILPRKALGWLLASISAALFVWVLTYLPAVTEQGALEYSLAWVPDLGLNFTIYLDGLALLFASVITGIGAVVALYTGYYFDDDLEANRFFWMLQAFMGAMLLVVMAGNVITLFIAWELTSITSFLLIGFKGNKYEDARFGALQALMVTGGGGLAMLVGLLLLGTASGTFEFSQILSGTDLRAHPWYSAFTILLLLGAFTKSAQWPFHFWLPGAMSAPSPASAYLHSATMVKAGVYLLARFAPALGDTDLWTGALTVIGLLTMFVGALLALRKRDLKALLAYSTISQLGALVALIGQPEAVGIKAAMIGILAHALYKAALFLSAGIIEHATGSRIIDKLGGLGRLLPGLTLIVGVSALSMAGVPPLFGFVAKETLLDVVTKYPEDWLPIFIVVVSATFTVVAGLIVLWDVFFRKPKAELHIHKPEWGLLAGPGLLAVGSLLLGFLLDPMIIPLIFPAVGSEFSLYLFPGWNLAFALSLAALALGLVMFLARGWWLNLSIPGFPSASGVYRSLVGAIEWMADQALRLQNGRLRYYLVIIISVVIILMLRSDLSGLIEFPVDLQLSTSIDLLGAVLVILTLGAAAATVLTRRWLAAALAMGVMGYALGGIFLLEPAPDVALVQFLVETLGTVLIVIMLSRISTSQRTDVSRKDLRQTRVGLWRDILISGAVGLIVMIFAVAAVTSRPERDTRAAWYLAEADVQTGVTDVVAAIVTDFRGTDTLIEIMVFGTAALGVLTLLTLPEARELLMGPGRARLRRGDVVPSEELRAVSRFSTPLTRRVAMIVLPFALIISLAHILYGGEGPGDGFTAGVVSGLAVALWYVVFGYYETRQRLPWLHPGRLVAVGWLVALVNALLPMIFGREFMALTKLTGIELPAHLHAASTVIFEVAIFLTVFGGVSVIMEAIAHPKEVERL